MGADLGADADLLATLYVAVTERRMVDFAYRSKSRRLAPHGIGHRSGHWYVVGVDASGKERVFRADRIEDLQLGQEMNAFERTPGLTVSAAMANHPWETGEGAALEVSVRFDESAAWWAERRLGRSGVRGRRNDDGSTEVTLTVNHLDAFLGWILSFGAQAEVLGPDEVRRALIERVEAVPA